MKFLRTLLIAFLSLPCFAQGVNDYSYIVVPEQFSFQKIPNQYQINELMKFLFNKYNFTAFSKGEVPEQIPACQRLEASLKNESNLFVTKVIVTLTDCKDKQIFASSVGKSHEKDFTRAYHQAIRLAFADIEALHHKKQATSPDTTNTYPELYAKNTSSGYLLVSAEGKTILTLQKTSLEHIFTATDAQGNNGIFYLKENHSVFEFNKNGEPQKQYYSVKFN